MDETVTSIRTKRCTACLLEKPVTEFHRAAAGQRFPDGYRSQCKRCANTRRRVGYRARAFEAVFICPICHNPLRVIKEGRV